MLKKSGTIYLNGRFEYLDYVLKKANLGKLRASNTKLMEILLRSGNFKEVGGFVYEDIVDQETQRSIFKIAEIASRLILEASVNPFKFRGTFHYPTSLIKSVLKLSKESILILRFRPN